MRLFALLGIGTLVTMAFDPFSIFLSVIPDGLVASTVIIYQDVLTIDTIRNWLRQNKPRLNDKAVAFAVKTRISNGQVRVVTGFYDVGKEDAPITQTYEAKVLDEKLGRILKNNNEVVLLT